MTEIIVYLLTPVTPHREAKAARQYSSTNSVLVCLFNLFPKCCSFILCLPLVPNAVCSLFCMP